jgi:ATP-dependent exoDNAse (exonuclease V) alpha subunit
MTVDKTFFLADQGISKELAYVGLTRSRHDTFISTQAKMIDEDVAAQAKAKADLEKKLARSESKKMAIQKEEALRRNQLAHGIS